jgi:signal transduction histidine kinase
LLIGQADLGCIVPQPVSFDLVSVVTDMVQDFQLLAAEESRQLVLAAPAECVVTVDKANLRQNLHNLLTNALKHGEGDLNVRVQACGKTASLLIVNRVARARPASSVALGLGLRVVAALVRLEPELRFQRRKARSYYAIRLVLPRSATAQSGSSSQLKDSVAADRDDEFVI